MFTHAILGLLCIYYIIRSIFILRLSYIIQLSQKCATQRNVRQMNVRPLPSR